MMESEKQLCTFYVDDLFLGVDVIHVQEVILYQEMTRVLLAPGHISGLINLRGQIVTAIDLRKRLNMEPRQADQLPMNVIVRDGENAVSLLVDKIGDVITVSDDTFEMPPATMRRDNRGLIQGAYKLPSQLLLVLDVLETIKESPSRPESRLAG
jgi:purine-binding chemotaxis protein CheW